MFELSQEFDELFAKLMVFSVVGTPLFLTSSDLSISNPSRSQFSEQLRRDYFLQIQSRCKVGKPSWTDFTSILTAALSIFCVFWIFVIIQAISALSKSAQGIWPLDFTDWGGLLFNTTIIVIAASILEFAATDAASNRTGLTNNNRTVRKPALNIFSVLSQFW
jgi:hypothetical protein